jgi:hypothetical protein
VYFGEEAENVSAVVRDERCLTLILYFLQHVSSQVYFGEEAENVSAVVRDERCLTLIAGCC